MNKTPHPEGNPSYTKSDYIRNSMFANARMMLALYITEGATLHEAVALTRQLQDCIQRAYHAAVQEAGFDLGGPYPTPPNFGEGLSDNNPFNPGDQNED